MSQIELFNKWFGLVLCHINHCRLLSAKFVFIHTNSSISNIQFSISTNFSSIWPIHRTISGAFTPGQNGPCSNGNEEVLRISQSSSIAGASPWDCTKMRTKSPQQINKKKEKINSQTNSFICTQLNSFKYCYATQTIFVKHRIVQVQNISYSQELSSCKLFWLFLWHIPHCSFFTAKSCLF